MAEFLRGALVGLTRELMTLDWDYPRNKQVHRLVQVDLDHGAQRLTIWDELLRVTEYLRLQVGDTYTFVVEP